MRPGLQLKTKPQRPWGAWIAGLIAISIFVSIAYFSFKWYTTGELPSPVLASVISTGGDGKADERAVGEAELEAHVTPEGHPRYISIPSLAVDKARVLEVDVNSRNILTMPENIHDAGWYVKSALPGAGMGAVVIDGRGMGSTKSGIFARLGGLQIDDKITIERGDGASYTYRVVENKTEDIKQALDTGMQRLMKPYDTTKEGLSIIAEAGNWIPRDKVYDKRVLVRAVVEK